MPEQLISELADEEQMFARNILAVAEQYGPFDSRDGGVWVSYEPASENEDADIGVNCSNCVFRVSENECELIAASIEDGGRCRFVTLLDGSVDEEVEASMDEFADINMTPPEGARAEARRGLAWRQEHNRGGTAVGVARARDIARGANLSPSTIRRMVSYFARHEVDKKGQGWSPGQDGYPSAGRIAWALWGGDPGRSWANRIARQMDRRDSQSLAYGKKKRKRKIAMKETFGSMPSEKPEGALRAVVFPELALMDVKTGDGRILESDGRGVRELPRTIYGQFVSEQGHAGAVPIGALHEVTFEDGVASGRGWLIDDENGRKAVQYIQTQTLYHNSVDLAEVRARYELSEDDEDVALRFSEWKIAATTLVGKPAFANAKAELIADAEIVASWYADDTPLVVDVPVFTNIDVAEPEIVADGEARPAWDAFHQAEADKPQKLFVDENGWVSGHLALWESCHDGIAGRCTRVPRPSDNYASFNKPGVLTDKGMVETGPIFLSGGHRKSRNGDYVSAYGGIENAWADVRVVAGKHGPWISGVVRPGVDDANVYAARASRISGHWVGGRLKAIVSVNAEGFDVPGSGLAAQVEYEFALNEDGAVAELVASLPTCFEEEETVETHDNTVEANKILLSLQLED